MVVNTGCISLNGYQGRKLKVINVIATLMKMCIVRFTFQTLSWGIALKVLLFLYLFRRNNANANENQMQTKPIFLWAGLSAGSTTYKPNIMPNIPPNEQKTSAFHSSWTWKYRFTKIHFLVKMRIHTVVYGTQHTFIKKMVKAAAVIPQDCIMSEKSLATMGLMPNPRVITGKATAPPPSDVIPVMWCIFTTSRVLKF